MNQYDSFLSKENFELAYERLKTASRNLYKIIYYEDLKIFGLFLAENIETTINHIRQDIYKPEKCHKIFVPKKDILVRPLSMLTFIDLLVYQALTNVIADNAFDIISPYYNNTIFGNIVNTSNANRVDKKFFFKSWKKRWKRFNDVSKEHFTAGYKFLSEFDIASFFDTIDHNILCELLSNNYRIDSAILSLLSKCLETWTADSNHQSFKSKHGIPQGPISSPFLADLYLFYIDTEIKKLKKYDFKYIRYVDDIRIFTKDKLVSKKLVAQLDLVTRDLGLIPQGSKILIKEIKDIDKELQVQNSKFSEIAKEYKKQNEGKPYGSLKTKTHKNLKKRFLACFDEKSDEIYLDKTVIGFSLYKLNADEDVKNILLLNYELVLPQFEGILFYFREHFSKDAGVQILLQKLINDEHILFHHLVALIFKFFPDIPFDEKVYHRYTVETHRYWLVNYYIIRWLHENGKKDLIMMDYNSENYYIQRELNNYKFISTKDSVARKIFSTKLLNSRNSLLALQGLNLLFHNPFSSLQLKVNTEQNDYVRFILTEQPSDIIHHTLKTEWNIANPETFFNKAIWNNDDVYEELRISFLIFFKAKDTDPSKAILNLNGFNNLLFDKICQWLSISKPSTEYGGNLKADIIESKLPVCNKYWADINEKRNQKSEAHPYDKYGNIRIRISYSELADLITKEKKAIEEICGFRPS
jgi:hypothetical protein